ncbi:ABC transporter ATP-binding protein [Rhodovarius crocodyli]|uniref:ABC transporter ATP-binding protein n=1 Tax=Rhodovarius crocodyli TaxID=1979269 RepID=A0A437MP34_9PROT|nr:ABC transporter ATP-binding protein [Rhodovarius crocodyli]RVT99408.1 ABC transporter ATP-binding protein [Rhodovarius crocodyli]
MLEATGLAAAYGPVKALDGVSLTVAQGEVAAVLGANGAGKSTLLRTLLGLMPGAGGTVRFCGEDISKLSTPERVRRGLVLVPEGRRVLTGLTVEENLLMGAYPRRDTPGAAELDAIYGRFSNLAARRHMKAGVLSGGEQQMLAIGRAMMARPKLMMLDEPSLGLSPRLTSEVFALIAALNAEGMSILLVEQNALLALEASQRALVLELGREVVAGTSAALLKDDRVRGAYLGAAA